MLCLFFTPIGFFLILGLYLLICRLLGAQRNLPPLSLYVDMRPVVRITEAEIAVLKEQAEAGDKGAARKLMRYYSSGPGNLFKDHQQQYKYWKAIADKD